jgi:hypothetical protein
MKVISINNDCKRAEVVCTQHGETVTRHAVLMPGTRNKYTIRNYAPWMRKDDLRAIATTTITIAENGSVTEGATIDPFKDMLAKAISEASKAGVTIGEIVQTLVTT